MHVIRKRRKFDELRCGATSPKVDKQTTSGRSLPRGGRRIFISPSARQAKRQCGRGALKRQHQRRGEDDAKTHHGDGYGIIGGELEHDEPPRPNLFLVPSPDPLQHRIQRNNGSRMVTRRLKWKNAAAGLATASAGSAGPVAVGTMGTTGGDALLIIAHVSPHLPGNALTLVVFCGHYGDTHATPRHPVLRVWRRANRLQLVSFHEPPSPLLLHWRGGPKCVPNGMP
jgi:hypothetical protein